MSPYSGTSKLLGNLGLVTLSQPDLPHSDNKLTNPGALLISGAKIPPVNKPDKKPGCILLQPMAFWVQPKILVIIFKVLHDVGPIYLLDHVYL